MVSMNGYDAKSHEPMQDFSVLPGGEYVVSITNSEEKANKKGTGSYLNFTFQVLEGEYKGRKLWAILNLNNPNKMAVDIAKSELSSICRAVNVLTPQDSLELHNIPLVVKIAVESNKATGMQNNQIKKYSSNSASTSTGVGASQVGDLSVSPDKAPWAK